MPEPLLIHSMAEFASITLRALEVAEATSVCEIGAEHGGNSAVLAEWLEARSGRLTSIDPSPSPAFRIWLALHAESVQHIEHPSLEAIPTLPAQDAWFIDGDHNWYSVYHELAAIHERQRAAGRSLLVFLHDVDWPCGRRDLYYAPERLPPEFVHPHTWERGVTPDSPVPICGGFRGCGAFAFALHEGGPRNGVLTAIEDFVDEHPDEMYWAHIPGVFGLGVLFDRSHPAANDLGLLLAPLHDHPLLKRLEASRLANYLKVIEYQDTTTTGYSLPRGSLPKKASTGNP